MLSDRALGEFISPPFGTKLHSCTQGFNNAISHSINTDKTRITVSWRAPSRPEPWIDSNRFPDSWIGPIQFVATVVESPREMFWTEIYSDIICEGEDIRPPTVVGCPEDITSQSPGPISWVRPTVMENYCDAIVGDAVTIRPTHSPGQSFPPGLTQVRYTYTDTSGNENTCTFNVNILSQGAGDTEPPVCRPTQDASRTTPPGSTGAFVTFIEPEAFDNSGTVTLRSRTHLPNSFFPGGTLTEVCYTFADPSQNTVDCCLQVVVMEVDITPPVVTCPRDEFRTTDCNTGGISVTFGEPTATDNSGTVTFVSRTHTPGQVFTLGSTEVTYTFTDPSGNTASCSFTVTVTEVDDTPPVCSQTNDIQRTISLGTGNAGTVVSWTEPTTTDVCSQVTLVSRSHAPGDRFFTGSNTVSYIFQDASNNRITCSFTVTITEVDDQPPVVTCPADISREVGFPVTGLNIPFTEGTATDNSGVVFLVSRSHSPNDFFMVGPTTVTYTFEDQAGNRGSCSFTITIIQVDRVPPTVVCPNDITMTIPLGQPGTTIQWDGLNAQDNSGTVILSSRSHSPGQFFVVGSTTVTYEFIDPSQNSNSCSFTVTIIEVDGTPPNVVCPPDQTITTACNTGGTNQVTLQPCTATDNSGQVNLVSQSHQSGQFFFVGATEVTFTFTDASGNRMSGSYTINVVEIDDTPPVCAQTNDIQRTISLVSGATSTAIAWTEPSATDVCSQVTLVSRSHAPGDRFFTGSTTVSYIFQDQSNNGVTCSFTITINEERVECGSMPCLNGGACIEGINQFACLCLTGWTGAQCETAAATFGCSRRQCFNQGVCVDGLNQDSSVCLCLPGFTGVDCQIAAPSDGDQCASQPCQNGAQCMDGINQFTCVCQPGYTGISCEINIDECASQPCNFGGLCIDGVNEYTCFCQDGRTGSNCEIGINECASRPCLNGGQCIEGNPGYGCICLPAWTGANCEINIDECASGPCVNGQCVDGINQYTCSCLGGWTGLNCEINIDECASFPCVNGGLCFDGINAFSCECQPGYTGTLCETNISGCASTPCLNGGRCTDGINGYICSCLVGFTGVNCEIPVSLACASQPCNFGVCYDAADGGDYECMCLAGYTGRNCDVLSALPCASQPCINGRCFDSPGGGYTCVCIDGYTGDNCQNGGSNFMFAFISCNKEDIIAVSSPGAGGAMATYTEPAVIGNSGGVFLASQTHVPGYFFPVGVTRVSYMFSDGINTADCDFNVIVTESACVSDPCLNGGSCQDTNTGYRCLCLEGFTGPDCGQGQVTEASCTPNPCMNSAACFESFGGIVCQCLPGFRGDRCQIANMEDPCSSQPCFNGGTCMTSGGTIAGYMCICRSGFTGPNCNLGVGQVSCANSPCLNGGQCVDLPGPDDICNCLPGFFGDVCEIGQCGSQPCQNGGSCEIVQGVGLVCFCTTGFTGDRCEIDFIPPTVECPSGISRTIDAIIDGTTMTWSDPLVEDNSGFVFLVSQSHQSGQFFRAGTTTEVTYQFSDNSQNVANCVFAVTVNGRQPAPDPCASNPCLNGASCRAFLNNDYFCNCTRGYTGVRCETREMAIMLNQTQMRQFEGNYDQVLAELPMENGIVSEEALSIPENYGQDVVPELTQAQEDQIMSEYGDIFFNEQDIRNEVLQDSRRKRRQTMSDKVCPSMYANNTKLVSISGSDRSNANEQAQLVQINKRVQWAFNVECMQQRCQRVDVFNADQSQCTCVKEEHVVTALIWNIKIARETGSQQLPVQLKTISIYTCGATIGPIS